MVYLPTIPAATDKPAQSQADIQENFTQLNNQFKTEHVAFNAATLNGQHKFVTLQRGGGVAPTGQNVILAQAVTPAGNPYLQFYQGTAAGYSSDFYSIPMTASTSKALAAHAGNHTYSLVDFTTFGGVGKPLIPQTGTILVYDDSSRTRSVFTTFVYIGGVLNIPGGQLTSGTTFLGLTSAGSVLQLHTNNMPAHTVIIKVTGIAV